MPWFCVVVLYVLVCDAVLYVLVLCYGFDVLVWYFMSWFVMRLFDGDIYVQVL